MAMPIASQGIIDAMWVIMFAPFAWRGLVRHP